MCKHLHTHERGLESLQGIGKIDSNHREKSVLKRRPLTEAAVQHY